MQVLESEIKFGVATTRMMPRPILFLIIETVHQAFKMSIICERILSRTWSKQQKRQGHLTAVKSESTTTVLEFFLNLTHYTVFQDCN